ncbi:MAG: hypothetical protein ACI85K_003632 [Hyphomicrobiaceae bacterium]|jgi:hypothetical protein
MGLVLDAPDHTTLSRRGKVLKVPLRVRQKSGRMDLVIDSSGLAIFGAGEWAAAKHGGKGIRGWKKLHIGVDGDGVIVGQRLTGASVDDGSVGVGFVDSVLGKVRRVIGDGAYDSRALYDAAISRGAKVVVPPIKTAKTGGRGCRARDRVVRRVRKVGDERRTLATTSRPAPRTRSCATRGSLAIGCMRVTRMGSRSRLDLHATSSTE